MENKKIGHNENPITKELIKIRDTLYDAYRDLMIGKGDKSFSNFDKVSKYKQDEAHFRGKKLLSRWRGTSGRRCGSSASSLAM